MNAEKQTEPQVILSGKEYSGMTGTQITELIFRPRSAESAPEPVGVG